MKNYLVEGKYVIRSLFKMGNIYYGRVRDTETGEEFRFTTRLKDKRKALQYVIDQVKSGELGRGKARRTPSGAPKRFEAAFNDWLNLKNGLGVKTLEQYRLCLKGIYAPRWGHLGVSVISPLDIEQFLADLKEREIQHHLNDKTWTQKVTLSTRTKRYHLSRLRSFFRWCVRNGYRRADPTDGIKIPAGPQREGVALTYEQARKLLEKALEIQVREISYSNRNAGNQTIKPPSYLFLAMLISLHTGLRRSNVTGLQWSKIDFAQRKITILGDEMKTKKKVEIPIHPELLEHLKEHLRKQEKVDADSKVLGKDIIDTRNAFYALQKRAGLVDAYEEPLVRWHDLRHTFSTWIGERHPYAVQKTLLGHTHGDITFNYTHISFETLKRAIDTMPNLLAKETSESKACINP